MPEKEELAVSKTAYVIFPWQVEQVLHIKFPGRSPGHWRLAL